MIQKDGTRKESAPIQKNQRPTRRKRPLTIWDKIARIFREATEGGTPVANRNKVYSQYGIGIGSPMYNPPRGKFKGYMRDKAYKNKRR